MVQLAQARPPFVEFKQVPVFDKRRSDELGYRVTKDVDRAFIMQPGSRDVLEINAKDWLDQIRRKVIDAAHDAYPQEWVDQFQKKFDMWKEGHEAPPNGTHVREWPLLSPAQVQNFVAMRIITIEDVAAMTEEAMGRFGMGARELRDKAREWLVKRDMAAGALKENEELKAQLAELTARLAALESDDAPRRGRKPKQLQEAA